MLFFDPDGPSFKVPLIDIPSTGEESAALRLIRGFKKEFEDYEGKLSRIVEPGTPSFNSSRDNESYRRDSKLSTPGVVRRIQRKDSEDYSDEDSNANDHGEGNTQEPVRLIYNTMGGSGPKVAVSSELNYGS